MNVSMKNYWIGNGYNLHKKEVKRNVMNVAIQDKNIVNKIQSGYKEDKS